MKVYFSENFWGNHKYERTGREIPVKKMFWWGGLQWCIPAVYICTKGLVLDFCVEIPVERIENYYKQWNNGRIEADIKEEDYLQMQKENPFSIDFKVQASLDGNELLNSRRCAVSWHPLDVEQDQYNKVQEELMEYYACDRSMGWRFIRASFPWKTSRKPRGRVLTLKLEELPVVYRGGHFVTEDFSEEQEIKGIHPITGMEHNLIISECKSQTLPANTFKNEDDTEYPNIFKVLSYRIAPELTMKEFGITDCARSDPPRNRNINPLSPRGISACSVGVIGRARSIGSISAIFAPDLGIQEYRWRTACSSLHFASVSKVEWRTMFYVKETEDIELEVLL
jgi:hypothetical protein